MTPSQVVDPSSSPFSYTYDDTSGPLSAAAAAVRLGRDRTTNLKPRLPEMVGASDEAVTLTGPPLTRAVALRAPSGPARLAADADAGTKTYLKIENIVSEESQATYEVYVNLPTAPDQAAYERHYAGALPLFGVIQASVPSERHAGNGLTFNLDISRVVDRLKAENSWDAARVEVTFVQRPGRNAGASAGQHEPIRVGRISVYQA